MWAVGRLDRAVRTHHGGHLELLVAFVDAPHADYAPAPHQLAGAAGEQRDVMPVADVVADGP